MAKKLTAVFIFLLSAQFLYSQEVRTYNGGFTFKGLRGTAELNYTLDPNLEPILNGPFSFSYTKMDSLQAGLFRKLLADGTYEDDQKTGNWSYQQETYEVSINDIQNKEIKASLSSNMIDLQAGYNRGTLRGPWDYSERKLQDEEYINIFEAKGINFENDSLRGKVNFISENPERPYQISGEVSKKGLMIGTWEFVYTLDSNLTIKETRRYERGFLIGLSKVNNQTNEKLDEVVFFNAIEKLDSLNQGLDVDYRVADEAFGLIFNNGYVENSEEFQEQYLGAFFLEDALSRVLQFEDDFFSDEDRLSKYPLSTRRFVYPISEDEQSRYDEIIRLYDQMKSETDQKALIDFLSLNKNTSDSLAFSDAYFDYLSGKIENYESVIALLRNGDIKYFDTENYLRDGLNFLQTEEEITYSFNTETQSKTLQFPTIGDQKNLARDLLAHIVAEWKTFRIVDDFIQKKQVNFRQTNELDVLEERILQEQGRVNELKDSLIPISERHEALLDSVYRNLSVDNYQTLLNQYNETEGFLDKAELGDEIIELFLFLEKTLPELAGYDSLPNTLSLEFTEKTLDPFTFETDFAVLRQPGLIQAATIILDYELEFIMHSDDFREVQSHLLNLDALESRIMDLKGRNTKRLERNIRKVGDNVNQLKKLLSI